MDNLDCEIHFFSEDAEVGLFGELPGIISKWPLIPSSWTTSMYSQSYKPKCTAVRRSWFEKAIAISLAKRNTFFHLRTRITNFEDKKVEFSGAGFSGSGTLDFDKIFTISRESNNTIWYGGVTTTEMTPNQRLIIGKRSDSTIEVWAEHKLPQNINWIQKMSWKGKTPKNSIESDIVMGIQRAKNFLDKVNID
jgi:hypothetical protein